MAHGSAMMWKTICHGWAFTVFLEVYWLGLGIILAGLITMTYILASKKGNSKCYIWEQYDRE
jgi:hypothetical protein